MSLTFSRHVRINFFQIGLVRPSVNFERLSLHSLRNTLKEHNVSVNVELNIDPYATPDEIIGTGMLKELRRKARSSVCLPFFKLICEKLCFSFASFLFIIRKTSLKFNFCATHTLLTSNYQIICCNRFAYLSDLQIGRPICVFEK